MHGNTNERILMHQNEREGSDQEFEKVSTDRSILVADRGLP